MSAAWWAAGVLKTAQGGDVMGAKAATEHKKEKSGCASESKEKEKPKKSPCCH